MEREAFLTRVRDAARQGQAYRIHHQEIPPGTGYVGAAGDVCEHFAAEVNLVGGQAVMVDDGAGAREALRSILKKYGARSALLWKHEVLERLNVRELLVAEGIAGYDYDALRKVDGDERDLALSADIGITSVELAIAETGTLLMWSKPGQERMMSLLPPVHVAIVAAEQIVPDLLDAFAELHRRKVENLPSNITLITGPSKTGDIELQLTTGVHGPKQWHVIVMRGLL